MIDEEYQSEKVSDIGNQPRHRVDLSPLDQLAPRYYIQGVLAFRQYTTVDGTEIWQSTWTRTVRSALMALFSQLPLLGYTVVETRHYTEDGRVELECPVSSESHGACALTVKHFSNSSLSYDELYAHGMPTNRLPGGFSPVQAVDGSSFPLDVCRVQLNFVDGGVFLCLAVYHAVFDGVGYGYIISQLARNCAAIRKGSPIAQRVCSEKQQIFPNNSSTATAPEVSCYDAAYVPDDTRLTVRNDQNTKNTSVQGITFTFTQAKLTQLRAETTHHDSHSETSEAYLSTLDIISALLWYEITRARHAVSTMSSSHPENTGNNALASPSTRFGLPVSSRAALNLPPDYVYNSVIRAATPPIPISFITSDAATQNENNRSVYGIIAHLATMIRQTIHSIDESYVHDVINISTSAKDVRIFQSQPGRNFISGAYDVVISSWMSLPVYDRDTNFGDGLGDVEFLRPHPGSCDDHDGDDDGLDGLGYALPPLRNRNDDVEVIVELEERVMEKLCESREWRRWTNSSAWII